MRPYYLFPVLLAFLFVSCKKNPDTPVIPDPPTTGPKDTVTAPDVKLRRIDSIRNIVKGNSGKYTVVSDSVWANNNGITFRVQMNKDLYTTDFQLQPNILERIYPGSLLKGNTVEELRYQSLTGYQQNKVTLYSTSPAFTNIFRTVQPSLLENNKFIKESLPATNAGQVDAVSFQNGSKFENYGEIAISTRNSWDYASLVILKQGDNGHIKKKNGFYLNADLSLFSVAIEPVTPEGTFFGPGINPGSVPDKPLLVSSVTYGRKAMIAIESDATFDQIKAACQATTDKKATAADQKLLNEAIVTVYMSGFKNPVPQSTNTPNGYERVNQFIRLIESSGTYNRDDYGTAISFTLNSAVDFSTARFGFKYRLDYPVN